MQLENLEELMYEIYNFKKLKILDISCNRLTKLPIDLSLLKSLESIDISNNLFDSPEQVLSSLGTIPCLVEVNTTIDLKTQRLNITDFLPNLQVFNGKVIKSGGVPKIKQKMIDTSVEQEKETGQANLSKMGVQKTTLFLDNEKKIIEKIQVLADNYIFL